MRNIVSVADVRQLHAAQVAKPFLESEIVGKRLAGMLQIAQRVNDGDRRELGHAVDCFLGESAQHNDVDPAFEIMRDVAQLFAGVEPALLVIPASKVRRVLKDGFSKNITICLPANAL